MTAQRKKITSLIHLKQWKGIISVLVFNLCVCDSVAYYGQHRMLLCYGSYGSYAGYGGYADYADY